MCSLALEDFQLEQQQQQYLTIYLNALKCCQRYKLFQLISQLNDNNKEKIIKKKKTTNY